MPFPFTFTLSVPGLSNPFTSTATTGASSSSTPSVTHTASRPDSTRIQPTTTAQPEFTSSRRFPSPAAPIAPLSRKRGWEPSFAEPSRSTTTLASSSGYLDTPAKYRDLAEASRDDLHEFEDMAVSAADLPPPAKRRRGLAGSIVSTALSAALIGTAVGLTVYRLWRDRGKEPPDSEHNQIPPPPPYHQGEWTMTPVVVSKPQPQQSSPSQRIELTPPTPQRRKTFRGGGAGGSAHKRRGAQHHQHQRARHQRLHSHAHAHASMSPQPNFAVQSPEHEDEQEGAAVEDQMDWIGDKLSMLIEEGKRALGREVVVMSETREDEVDDGSGAWEEEEGQKKRRPGNLNLIGGGGGLPPYASRTPSASPRGAKFDFSFAPSSSVPVGITPSRSRGLSPDVGGAGTPSSWQERVQEDQRTWESPELRESMEKARARAKERAGMMMRMGG